MSGDWSGLVNSLTIPQGAGPGTPRTVFGPTMPALLAAHGYDICLKIVYYFPGDDSKYYYECATESTGISVGFVDPARTPAVNEIRTDTYLGGPSALFQTYFAEIATFVNGAQFTVDSQTHSPFDFTARRLDINNGDRVYVNSRTLSGRIANYCAAATADSTTSATYVTMAGPSGTTNVAITKDYDETQLRVDFHCTMYASGAAAGARIGVWINGTDYDVDQLATTNGLLNSHTQLSGSRVMAAGLGANTYTVFARWLRTGGAGTLTRDTNDWISLTVQEVGEP